MLAVVAADGGPLALLLVLDAVGGLAGVLVVDVGDRHDVDVLLGEERVEELAPATPRADQPQPMPPLGASSRPIAGRRRPPTAPAAAPAVSTKPRLVYCSLAIFRRLSRLIDQVNPAERCRRMDETDRTFSRPD